MHTWIALMVLGAGVLGGADPAPEPAALGARAYYTASLTDALPPILTDEVPPAVVCVLVPELCAEELELVTGPVQELLGGARLPPEPVQLVAPETLPVGLIAGQPRYVSAIHFPLPETPVGKAVERVELKLRQSGLSYAFGSPSFREAVEALISQVDEPSPEPFIELLTRIAEDEGAVIAPELAGVEICPIVEPWEAGDNQDIAHLPASDCTFGSSGSQDGDTWAFDITLAARGWSDGTTPDLGLTLAPMGPANLAYGDPDTSAWFQVGFAATGDDGPRLAIAYAPLPEMRVAPGAVHEEEIELIEIPLGLSDLPVPVVSEARPAALPPVAQAEPTTGYLPWWFWPLAGLGVAGAVAYRRALRDDAPAVAAAGALTSLLARQEPDA